MMNYEIYHHGIKGRKWGIRNENERVTSAERMHYITEELKNNKDLLSRDISRHQDKIDNRMNRDTNRTGKKIAKIQAKSIITTAAIAAATFITGMMIHKKSDSMLRQSDNLYKSNRHSDDTRLERIKVRANYILRGVRIAAESTLAGLKIWQNSSVRKLKLSRKLGTKTNKKKDALKKGREEKKLKHSGILGMKWGIRRYQNPDGTLTSAGKARYSQKTGEELDARDMSDDELVSATNRLNRERNYNFASGKQSKNPGYKKDIARKVSASVLGTFAASSLASLLYNKLNGKNALHGKDLAKRTLANGVIAAGLSGIMSLVSSTGGITSTNTPIDNIVKNQQQSKKEG